jgi:hypothetical protein
LKYASNLLHLNLYSAQATQVGGNKLLGKILDSDFVFLVCRLERTMGSNDGFKIKWTQKGTSRDSAIQEL